MSRPRKTVPSSGKFSLSGPDPIFAAILKHRAAIEAFNATCRGRRNTRTTAWNLAYKRNAAALYRVVTTDPTTVRGIVAVLRHVGWHGVARDDGSSILAEASVGANGGTSDWDRAVVGFPRRLAAVLSRISRAELAGARSKAAASLHAAREKREATAKAPTAPKPGKLHQRARLRRRKAS
jgi:hypothetical protein